ncbi:MAG TPA: hypothetical protein VK752_09215 [Bryobacteraceae bacterium]|jgi:hypothetical protein|nr:hypothetical protein [Bryobacteraceae bacterium]
MKKIVSIAVAFLLSAAFAAAQTWSGRLVDAVCKATNEGQDSFTASCGASTATHLFAIELAGAKVLILNAAGNQMAASAVKDLKKTDLHATVTGALEGQFVNVESIDVQ